MGASKFSDQRRYCARFNSWNVLPLLVPSCESLILLHLLGTFGYLCNITTCKWTGIYGKEVRRLSGKSVEPGLNPFKLTLLLGSPFSSKIVGHEPFLIRQVRSWNEEPGWVCTDPSSGSRDQKWGCLFPVNSDSNSWFTSPFSFHPTKEVCERVLCCFRCYAWKLKNVLSTWMYIFTPISYLVALTPWMFWRMVHEHWWQCKKKKKNHYELNLWKN